MKEWWKDYFSFTKKERTGAIILSILIIAVFVAPHFFQQYYSRPDAQEIDWVQKEIAALKSSVKDSLSGKEFKNQAGYVAEDDDVPAIPGKLFNFNPNTLPAEGWKKLGLKEKQIQTIMRYIGKGGKFRRPEDLKRMYGLYPGQAERLIPFVVITNENTYSSIERKAPLFKKYEDRVNQVNYKVYKKITLDINLADTTAWIALPGIGSKLATRIVNFRNRLGGFHTIEQVAETFGLPDSVFQKIKSQLLISATGIKKININTCSIDDLKQHPYIRWNNAQAIVRYREQHGLFTSLDELSGIQIITPDLLEKMKPYLIIN